MKECGSLEAETRKRWDEENACGAILFRADTLTERTINCEGQALHLLHNSCRDIFDRQRQHCPPSSSDPFCDGTNPELCRSEDGWFRILGNRFACVRYQGILVPTSRLDGLTHEFFVRSLRFAGAHPAITLMYNARNAGRTLPQQYWLLGFKRYAVLASDEEGWHREKGDFLWRPRPCYMISLSISDVSATAHLLYGLALHMHEMNFNIFLSERRATFIPRHPLETPDGFRNHRFGGLEMLGHFVMKSLAASEEADGARLLAGIRQIGLEGDEQRRFEDELLRIRLEQ